VPPSIKDAYNNTRGARVTIQNQVSTMNPVQITGMRVQNRANTNQNISYNSTTWEPGAIISNGESAVQMVISSPAMPIRPGVQFDAVITLVGNGETATITNPLNPAVLYSDLDPTQYNSTVTITDSDIPDEVKTPVPPTPKTEQEVKDEIYGAREGDTIVIDGIEWIKVRHYSFDMNKVLLMLKGVTGSPVQYNEDTNCIEYNGNPKPSIKAVVDNWYDYLNSPVLKRIALLSNVSETPNQTWPSTTLAGTKAGTVAFIPKMDDINTTNLSKANGFRYWLSDINFIRGCRTCCIIKANGDFTNGLQSTIPDIYIRPCVWVLAR
jgi:hypothetical protein